MPFWWDEAEYKLRRKRRHQGVIFSTFMSMGWGLHLVIGLIIGYLVVVYL